MSNTAARFGGGFLALAAIWIGAYWLWEPSRSAGVSFADTSVSEPEVPPDGGEAAREVDAVPGGDAETAPLATGADGPDGPPDPPATDAEPAPGVVPPQFQDYTVRSGDTFESISRRFFNTVRRADAIAAANAFVDPTRLRAGQVIRVPLDPDNIQGQSPEGVEADLPEPEVIEYTVVRGDTLSEIAQHFYGSLRYADVIYHANRDTMGSIDDLQVGQVLRIPSRKSVLGEDD